MTCRREFGQTETPLQSKRLIRIGKEGDRLGGDEGATLEPEHPVEYERDELAEQIDFLAQFPQNVIASEIGMSERRWRDIVQGRTNPRVSTAAKIERVANERGP